MLFFKMREPSLNKQLNKKIQKTSLQVIANKGRWSFRLQTQVLLFWSIQTQVYYNNKKKLLSRKVNKELDCMASLNKWKKKENTRGKLSDTFCLSCVLTFSKLSYHLKNKQNDEAFQKLQWDQNTTWKQYCLFQKSILFLCVFV